MPLDKKYQTLPIKSWAQEDRPREKLLIKSKGALSDSELIAIIIGSGTAKDSAVEVARKILNLVDNDLNALGKLSVQDILDMKVKGIGTAKTIAIIAALELGRRRQSADRKKRTSISSSADVAKLFQPKLADHVHEEFWVLMLNRANLVIHEECISSGGLAGTVADIRIIYKQAISRLASSIIVCHNHPSGNLKPSEADIELTKKLKDAGQLMDIQMLDHVIVSETGYFSFADEGLI